MLGQCRETVKDKLQSLQNKAVKTITGQSYKFLNHNRLLKELGWLSLIKLDMGVFMYKTQNGMAPEEFSQLFVPVGNIQGYLTRSAENGNLQLPQMKLKCAQGSISHSGAKLWNNIPLPNPPPPPPSSLRQRSGRQIPLSLSKKNIKIIWP